MITKLVPIGTSKGIRLSKAILQQCGIKDEIELEVKGHEIILKPRKKRPREGWEEMFAQDNFPLTEDEKAWLDVPNDFDKDEWEWK